MTPSQQIDKAIAELTDWRGSTLAELRKIILEADDSIVEEWKWGTPVWSSNGLICAAAAFKDHVKLNFFKGASLPDPTGIFNDGLTAKLSRAVRFNLGDKPDPESIAKMVKAARQKSI